MLASKNVPLTLLGLVLLIHAQFHPQFMFAVGYLRFSAGYQSACRRSCCHFYLQVTPMRRTEFQFNWPFGSGEELKNRFSRQPPRRPSWISDRNDFSCFELQVTLMLPTKFQVSWPNGSGEEAKKKKGSSR